MSFSDLLNDFASGFTKGMELGSKFRPTAKEQADAERAGVTSRGAKTGGIGGSNFQANVGDVASRPAISTDPVTSESKPVAMPAMFREHVRSAAETAGVSPTYLETLIGKESGWNPDAVSKTGAKGLGQFTSGTARDMGLTDPLDPVASIYKTAELAAKNKTQLTKALGREPSEWELKLAHNQGAGGAGLLLRADPNLPLNRIRGYNTLNASHNLGEPTMRAGDYLSRLRRFYGDRADTAIPLDELTMSASHGGLIQHFAEGGVVDPAFTDDAGQRQTAIESGAPDLSDHYANGGRLFPGVVPAIDEAVAPKEAVGNPQAAMARWTQLSAPENKPTPEQYESVRNMVDPPKKLDEHMRTIASFNALYDHYMKKGDAGKAQQAVVGMFAATSDAIREAGAYARAAGERGDVAGMARAIQRGYQQMPDGSDIKITRVTPEGAEFKMYDETGRITQEGKASINDMMKLATGMSDGSAFFSHWGQFSEKSSKEVDAEKRQKAIEEFSTSAGASAGVRGQYLERLDEDARKKFLKMDPRDQNKIVQENLRAASESAKQNRWNLTHPIEIMMAEKHKDAIIGAQEDIHQANLIMTGGGDSEQKQENFETRTAQAQARINLAKERLSYIKSKDERAAAYKAAGLDKIGVKEWRERRATEAIDTSTQERLRSIENTATDELGNPMRSRQYITDTNKLRGEAIQGGATFQKTPDRPLTKLKDEDIDVIRSSLETTYAGKDPNKKLNPALHDTLANIAVEIRNKNPVDNIAAANLVMRATNPDADVRVLPGGMVSIDPNTRPVAMSEDAILRLAMARGQNLTTGGAREKPKVDYPSRPRKAIEDNTPPVPSVQKRPSSFDTVTDAAAGAVGTAVKSVLRAPIAGVQAIARSAGETAQALEAEAKRTGVYEPGMTVYDMRKALLRRNRYGVSTPWVNPP